MRKKILLFVTTVFLVIALTVGAVSVVNTPDTVQAVTSDGTRITMSISTWRQVGSDCAFQVKFSYTGGHGGYALYACVPWLELDEDQSNYTSARQYRSAAINEMITLIEQREADMNQRDTRADVWEYLKNWTGRVGRVTLR